MPHDRERLLSVATERGRQPRGAGKTYFDAIQLLAALECTEENAVYAMLEYWIDREHVLREIYKAAEALDIQITRIDKCTLSVLTKRVFFITDWEQTRGTRYPICFFPRD